jgi:hypothetical protein
VCKKREGLVLNGLPVSMYKKLNLTDYFMMKIRIGITDLLVRKGALLLSRFAFGLGMGIQRQSPAISGYVVQVGDKLVFDNTFYTIPVEVKNALDKYDYSEFRETMDKILSTYEGNFLKLFVGLLKILNIGQLT